MVRTRPDARVLVGSGIAVAVVLAFMLGWLVSPDGDGGDYPTLRETAAGPQGTEAGVPIGHPRTPEGAVAALAAYGQVFAQPTVQFDERRRTEVLDVVAAPEYARQARSPEARRQFAAFRETAFGRSLRGGARWTFQGAPLAYRLLSYRGDRAVVRVWSVAVTGNDRGVIPRASWTTATTTARWIDGRWRVAAVRSTAGPTPVPAGGPSPERQLLGELGGLRPLRYSP